MSPRRLVASLTLLVAGVALGIPASRHWVGRNHNAAASDPGVIPLPYMSLLTAITAADQAAGTLVTDQGVSPTVEWPDSPYCTRSDGGLIQLSGKVACVEAAGLHMEPTSTNYQKYSQNMSTGAIWLQYEGGMTNGHLAPDGTSTADAVTLKSSGSDAVFSSGGYVGIEGQTLTCSVYVRTVTAPSASYYVSIWDDLTGVGGWHTIAQSACSVSPTWRRCSVTSVVSGAFTSGAYNCSFGTDNVHNTQVNNASDVDVYTWQAQAETLPFYTSPIKTTGTTAVRVATIVNMLWPAPNAISFCMSSDVTFEQDLATISTVGQVCPLCALDSLGGPAAGLIIDTSSLWRANLWPGNFVESVQASTPAYLPVAGDTRRMIAEYNPSGMSDSISVKSGNTVVYTASSPASVVVAAQPYRVYLGYTGAGATGQGWFKNLKIGPTGACQ